MGHPAPGKPLFEAASANFSLHSPAKVDTGHLERGPLLLIWAAGITLCPRPSPSPPEAVPGLCRGDDLAECLGRGHSLTIDSGWRAVANDCLSWLAKQGLCDDAGTMMALRAHARAAELRSFFRSRPGTRAGGG